MLDSRLNHLIEARNSLRRHWKRQRHNRKLRKRIAQLNGDIEHHSAVLCRQQWHAVCQEADGQLHKDKTWRLLHHLLNDQTSKGAQHYMLNKTIHKAVKEMGEAEVQRRLDAKYLPVTPTDPLPSYEGATNERLGADIEEWEVDAGFVLVDFRDDDDGVRELDGPTEDLRGREAKDGKAEKTRKRRNRKEKRNHDEQDGGEEREPKKRTVAGKNEDDKDDANAREADRESDDTDQNNYKDT
ncbi:hypothetical protein HPB52_021403 [Rhipicephalus sanguineus]|uniref:Uncharacterized protein n=1 Tax=Rhipicephalus sanguineus TaxID=34632 RepID=A0A9D4PMZ7_RHISA|nr:hypothetical protein HPB52_021403 [Rhipicephalus sanguineus]